MAFVIAQIWPCLLATFALGGLVAWFLNRSMSTFVAKADLPDFALFARTSDLPKPPDLSGYARTSDIPTLPDLSQHALRSDLPDVGHFITAAALAPLALKSDISTPDLSPYARKTDIPALPDLSGFARTTDIPRVPPPPDLSGYAVKSDIPDVSGFITAAALAPLAMKSDIVTADLSPYAKKTDIPTAPDLSVFALKADIPHVPPPPDLSVYAAKGDIPNVGGFLTAAALAPLALKSDIKAPDLSEYVRRSELPAAPDLSHLALKSELPLVPPPVDLSAYVRKGDLPEAPDLSGFALKSDIPQMPAAPDLSGFARTSDMPSLPDLSAFVRRSELPAMPDLSGFATRNDLPTVPDLSGFARLADLPGQPDLSTYVRHSDLPDLSGVVRVQELETQLKDRDSIISRLNESLRAEEATRTSEIARLEGLLRDALARKPEPPKQVVNDDLEMVYGIGPVLATRLNKLGVTSFAQIARWTDADIDTIEPKLDTIQGRIRREGWVPDSSRLHQEKYGEHIEVVATRKGDGR